MATQTTYAERHSKGFPGMIATTSPSTLSSCNAEEAVLFGAVVVKGTGDRDGKSPNANGENAYKGIAVSEVSARLAAANTPDRFNVGDEIRYMEKGDIWVTAGENVTAGEGVYVIEATGAIMGGTATTNQFQIPNAKWKDTTSSGQLGRIELR